MKCFVYIFLTGVLVSGAGCKKAFLNDPRPNEDITGMDVFRTPAGVRMYFNGIYRYLHSGHYSDSWSGQLDQWDNSGLNSINLARVIKGTDFINPDGFHYYREYRYTDREPAFPRVTYAWYFLYRVINQLNVLINGVEQSNFTEKDRKVLIAEARALRGWLYFELIRDFQHPVTRDAHAPGIPLYDKPTTAHNNGRPRGTVGQVFDFINADIEYAIKNGDTTRALKSHVNAHVAWGMAARIYLEQERWQDAVFAARNARTGYRLDASGYRNSYKGLTSPEVIWGFQQSKDDQTLGYWTPSSFYEKTGKGRDNFYVSSGLFSCFSLTDIRNTFFITDTNPDSPKRFATNKFGKPSARSVTLLTGETVSQREMDQEESLPMMRVAEMYLIEAEAKAMSGQADAGEVLYTLQRNRDSMAIASNNTGTALIEEILLERRKELYGELGIDWLDIKRRQLPLVRTGNHPEPYRFVFPPNDNRMILKIPQMELDRNEYMNEKDQNP